MIELSRPCWIFPRASNGLPKLNVPDSGPRFQHRAERGLGSVAGPVFVGIPPAGSLAGPGGYPGGLPRQGRIAGSCLLTVRRPLPQTRQVSSAGGDG